MKTHLFKIVSISLSVFVASCSKISNEKTTDTQLENQNKLTINVKAPEVKNGILKFTNFPSFRHYNPEKSVDYKGMVTVTAKGTEPFISMKQAFDSIAKADAVIAEQLRINYPNGPATVYDNTHTALSQTFPNSIFVAGNASDGYYYDVNSFDFGVTNKINKDGFVIIENWLLQYSKDSLKMWLIGNNGINGRFSSSVAFSANMKNEESVNGFKTKLREYQTKNTAARTLLNWTPIPEDFKSSSCQNTKRSGGVNRRVVGYIDYQLHYGYTPIIGYETSIRNRSLSLKGRLFGSWYDSWATGQTHNYFSIGSIQQGNIIFENAVIDYANPYFMNWNYNDDYIQNNASEIITWSPRSNAFLPLVITAPILGFVTISDGNKPAFTKYDASFRTASGQGSQNDPYCSCSITR
jgi:hypothetical protein